MGAIESYRPLNLAGALRAALREEAAEVLKATMRPASRLGPLGGPWTDQELPHENTIGEILNRLGYKLRRVQKAKPLKKIKETEAIFADVRRENQAADDDPDVIRISMDAEAKVSVGDDSRDGNPARPSRSGLRITTPSPSRS